LAEELKYKDDFMGEKENNQGDMEKLVKSLQSNLVGGKAGNEEEIKKLDLARKKIRYFFFKVQKFLIIFFLF
jgi:hypothetical protein